ncbi:PREDICTED: uncharacterized protein LOC106922558 isoform X2 [Poecilia mexicana]|uniref:uncharacterized protein LOC103150102 isoform X2 n=1 Tax=Poecilia formosa TaxID=48698 RepID=UPI00044431E7|nr:PREDICTED: uncharacterized protein LOC103150102 isoform X2 [Poecilia formosa]XP_014850566.1 PREDICTED: uncharacterized protein LOC106922558 isoform X2 [Poecilia mexicana]
MRFPDAPNTNMDRVVVEVPINNAPRKRQVRFSARHDIILLREVIAQNPFGSKEPGRMWARVGEIITAALQEESFEVDARRCRERTMLLLDYYKKQDFPSLRRFGTEKLYAQKEDLLHEVLELEAEKGLLVSGDGAKYQDEEPRNHLIEELTLTEPDKPNVTRLPPLVTEAEEEREHMAELSAAPTAKRPCQCCCQTYSEILSFLEKRSEAEQRLREEELSLRREELEIQRSGISFAEFNSSFALSEIGGSKICLCSVLKFNILYNVPSGGSVHSSPHAWLLE